MFKLLCVALITFLTGMAVSDVGTVSEATTYTWALPMVLCGLLTTVAVLAYAAGFKDGRH